MVVVYRLISSFESEDNPLGSIRGSHPEMFLRKGVLKIYSRFTGEYLYRKMISIKLLCNFIETTLRHGCSTVNLLYVFRKAFRKNTSRQLLLAHPFELGYLFTPDLNTVKTPDITVFFLVTFALTTKFIPLE